MVGVGGGATSPQHDSRLSDVVVSSISSNSPGVYQFDFGKRLEGGHVQQTGVLSPPPTALRTAVGNLRAEYEWDFIRFRRVSRQFCSVAKEDRLYQPHVTHPKDSNQNCSTACGDYPSVLVPQQYRSEGEGDPAIHYGVIASSNQVVTDAKFRDKSSRSKGTLCFEMEATGLMNYFFPFLNHSTNL